MDRFELKIRSYNKKAVFINWNIFKCYSNYFVNELCTQKQYNAYI